MLWYRCTCLVVAQQDASQSGEAPQGAGIRSKPSDTEHLTKVKDK